jgi:hypothetical protein
MTTMNYIGLDVHKKTISYTNDYSVPTQYGHRQVCDNGPETEN